MKLIFLFGVLFLFFGCNEKPEVAPQSADFKAFPNPITDYIGIVINNTNSDAYVLKIFDTHGKIIFEKQANEQSAEYRISVTGMDKGTYQAILSRGNVTLTNKLIKL